MSVRKPHTLEIRAAHPYLKKSWVSPGVYRSCTDSHKAHMKFLKRQKIWSMQMGKILNTKSIIWNFLDKNKMIWRCRWDECQTQIYDKEQKWNGWRRNCISNQNWACFVCYLKMINIVFLLQHWNVYLVHYLQLIQMGILLFCNKFITSFCFCIKYNL